MLLLSLLIVAIITIIITLLFQFYLSKNLFVYLFITF